jgi:hypothetical protein
MEGYYSTHQSSAKCRKWKFNFKLLSSKNRPITVAAPSETRTVFARSNTGIVGSNSTWIMDVRMRLFSVQVAALRRPDPPSNISYRPCIKRLDYVLDDWVSGGRKWLFLPSTFRAVSGVHSAGFLPDGYRREILSEENRPGVEADRSHSCNFRDMNAWNYTSTSFSIFKTRRLIK